MAVARGALAGVLALARLREDDVAWRLLRAEHADLIAGLLGAHLGGEVRRIAAEELAELLDADLDALRGLGYDLPRTSAAYLTDWRVAGFLIRRVADGTRGETLELSPEALGAIRTLGALAEPRSSVTESRLQSIADQAHRLAVQVDPDVERRLEALRAERAALDERIARLEAGEVEAPDPERVAEAVRDLLQQAQELPTDFARVRARFEALNRELRERIVQADDSDRYVLAEVFRGVDVIAESEEGRSFDAFNRLVLDPSIGSALEDDIDLLLSSPGASTLTSTERRFLSRFLASLRDHGREVQGVVTTFARGLRRYVQTQEFQREQVLRRLLQETLAFGVEAARTTKPYRETGVELALSSLTIRSAGAVALHHPADLDASAPIEDQPSGTADIAALRALARETEIDWEELRGAIAEVLAERGPVSVAEIVAVRPASQGVASIAGLVTLASDVGAALDGFEDVSWSGLDDVERRARIPRLVFEEVPA